MLRLCRLLDALIVDTLPSPDELALASSLVYSIRVSTILNLYRTYKNADVTGDHSRHRHLRHLARLYSLYECPIGQLRTANLVAGPVGRDCARHLVVVLRGRVWGETSQPGGQ
jgi:hypothetical protein